MAIDQESRSLYECQNARAMGTAIKCSQGHRLSGQSKDGNLSILRLVRGTPLIIGVCQNCPQFDRNGGPIPEGERGWDPSEREKSDWGLK